MNPSWHRMWNALLLVVSALSIAGCHCCPLPPAPFTSRTEEMSRELRATEVAEGEAGEIVGCIYVLWVARIPFRCDVEGSHSMMFRIFVPPEKAELARSALSRWADCPGYRCEIIHPVSTIETAVEE